MKSSRLKRPQPAPHPPELSQRLDKMKAGVVGEGMTHAGARTRRGELENQMYETMKDRKQMELELATQQEELQLLRDQLYKEKEERRTTFRKIDDARQAQRDLEARMSEMEMTQVRAANNVDTIHLDGMVLERQIAGLKEESTALDGQLVVQRKARTLLQQQCAIALKESQQLQQKIARGKQEVAKLRKESNQLDKEVQNARRDHEQDEWKKEQVMRAIEKRKEERGELRNAVMQGRHHVRALQTQVTTLEHEQLRMQETNQAAKSELISIESKLGKLHNKNPVMANEAHRLASQTASLQEHIRAAGESSGDLERHLAVVEDRLDEIHTTAKKPRRSLTSQAYYSTADSIDDELNSIAGAEDISLVAQASPMFGKPSYSPDSFKDSMKRHSPSSEEAHYQSDSDCSVDDLLHLEGDIEGLARKRDSWLDKVTARWLTPAAVRAAASTEGAASDDEVASFSEVSTPRRRSSRSGTVSSASVMSTYSAASTTASTVRARTPPRQAKGAAAAKGVGGGPGKLPLSRSASVSTIASTCVPGSSASSAKGVPTGLAAQRRSSAASASSLSTLSGQEFGGRSESVRRASVASARTPPGATAAAPTPPRTGWIK
eukprot:TRINITY_DN111752_c0_g1_i1.p1 TRINITY_DN111752_c0_g1~~TRINITY_DN111752_c0_g1_i1.p1  ORF type:complete len:607 (-),score=178.16 TRINITY_DN111752_c0_g1_i1:92-1912(-)